MIWITVLIFMVGMVGFAFLMQAIENYYTNKISKGEYLTDNWAAFERELVERYKREGL